jgi:hypothetical protein
MSEMAFSADGDFMSDVVGIVDTTLWTAEDFDAVDRCARVDRYNLALALMAIRRAELMSVAEFFVPRK